MSGLLCRISDERRKCFVQKLPALAGASGRNYFQLPSMLRRTISAPSASHPSASGKIFNSHNISLAHSPENVGFSSYQDGYG